MSDISETVHGKKIEDFPVTLVRNIEKYKGKEITLKELDSDIPYRLKTQRTDTVRLQYGPEPKTFRIKYGPFTYEEVCKIIQENMGINHSIKYYLVPIKSKKK